MYCLPHDLLRMTRLNNVYNDRLTYSAHTENIETILLNVIGNSQRCIVFQRSLTLFCIQLSNLNFLPKIFLIPWILN